MPFYNKIFIIFLNCELLILTIKAHRHNLNCRHNILKNNGQKHSTHLNHQAQLPKVKIVNENPLRPVMQFHIRKTLKEINIMHHLQP